MQVESSWGKGTTPEVFRILDGTYSSRGIAEPMTIKKCRGSNKRTGRCLLTVTGNLTIDTVSQNHATLAELFADYRDFEIDLSSVEEIDCSGIQLLLALQHSARSEDKRLTLQSASSTVNDAIDLLQLRRQFDWIAEL